MRLHAIAFVAGLLFGQVTKIPLRQMDVSPGQGIVMTPATIDVGPDVVLKHGTNDLHGSYYFNGLVGGNGDMDLSGASRTRLKSGSTDPPTCSEGDWFYNTTIHAPKVCIAPNIWRQL